MISTTSSRRRTTWSSATHHLWCPWRGRTPHRAVASLGGDLETCGRSSRRSSRLEHRFSWCTDGAVDGNSRPLPTIELNKATARNYLLPLWLLVAGCCGELDPGDLQNRLRRMGSTGWVVLAPPAFGGRCSERFPGAAFAQRSGYVGRTARFGAGSQVSDLLLSLPRSI